MIKFQETLKRVVAFGGAAVMIGALATGCGPGNTTSSGASNAAPDGSGTATESGTTSEREVRDLGGYTFTYLSLFGGADVMFAPDQGKSDEHDLYYERNQKLMKDWNFKIEIIEKSMDVIDDYIISTALAGDNPADFIMTDYSHMMSYRDADVLRPINELKNIDVSNTEKWQPGMTKACTKNDKVYGINTTLTPGIVMFYNDTLLKELNIESPAELYKQGKWTWSEFKRLVTKSTIDNNGDGTPEMYGMALCRWSSLNFEMPMAYTNGVNLIDVPDGSDPVFNGTTVNVQESLAFIKDMFDANIIDPNWDLTSETSANAFMTRKCAFMPQQVNWWGYLLEMEDDYGFVPLPKGPRAEDHISVAPQLVMFVSTIGCEDPDTASLIFDLLMERPPKTGDPALDDPDNYLKTVLIREENTLDIYKDLQNKTIPCLPMAAPSFAWSCWLPAVDDILADKTTPQAAMESIAEASKIYLKEAFVQEE